MRSASESKLNFFIVGNVKPVLDNHKRIAKIIENMIRKEGRTLGMLTYVFCNDKYLLRINQQYLGHDEYTDIISFDLSEKNGPLIGEIYISIPRVRYNAAELEEPIHRELTRVILHGALHLCGYNDKNPVQRKVMKRKEDEYLSKL